MSGTALVRAPGRTAGVICQVLLLQAVAGVAAGADPDRAVVQQLMPLRTGFLERIDEEGYRGCTAPTVEPGDPAWFAHYVSERNVLQVATWTHLRAQQRDAFEAQAREHGATATARAIFLESLRWVFVHELGHWWQTCRQQRRPASLAAENGANRIALAFWRERDARFAATVIEDARSLLRAAPSPLPPGASVQDYLQTEFQSLAAGGEYEWFQARMIVDLADERPRPSFHKALSQPRYPY